jgi:hypothetical protein
MKVLLIHRVVQEVFFRFLEHSRVGLVVEVFEVREADAEEVSDTAEAS